jgi:ADP-heptose:LPS heptosyltransferase/SAM-dependent methyltransferase
MPTKIILRTGQCPGDTVVMTAALRELHRQYPNQYQTDVRTCAREIWEHNPFITPIADDDRDVRTIQMHYPLINQSNQRPVHFLEGYCDYLACQLGLPSLRPQEFRGDIHLSDEERGSISQVEETTGYDGPFWLVNAGSKNDFTCKQWPLESFQAVVDHFRGRITFVQIGAAEHNHPPLWGVIDLRGQTDHRQLIRLVYHSAGVLTGVSYPMHLAAAVPLKGFWHPEGTRGSGFREKESVGNALCGVPPASENSTDLNPKSKIQNPKSLRPCVVINGGREPPHWEQYPGHQLLHTIGALDCCATGGCWKSRVVALGDGDQKDRDLCQQPVAGHPRCMRLITPDDVIRAIEKYPGSIAGSAVCEVPGPGETSPDKETRGQGDKETSVGNDLCGVPQAARAAPLPLPPHPKAGTRGWGEGGSQQVSRTIPQTRILIDFRHGLGDAVQLTTVLLHLRHYHPDWQIDVAAGIGKLTQPKAEGKRQKAEDETVAVHDANPKSKIENPKLLYDRLLIRGRDAIDRGAYQQVFDLAWDECPTCYADSPSTKAEYCLRTVFQLEPIPGLCRYELSIGADAMAKAKAYLESICGPGTCVDERYPAVLLHYQANTSTDKKDLPHELARRACNAAIEAGYVPVILDWDRRSPLPGEKGPDGVRIFNPGANHPLWGGIGTGDSEVLAALIAQSSLFIGVDSGPLHVAGATEGFRVQGSGFRTDEPQLAIQNPKSKIQNRPTPVIAVWTGHHALHYFGLADHVTHLLPVGHASRLRGNAALGQSFFDQHYHYRTYRRIEVELPALLTSVLTREPRELARNKEFLRQLRATGYTEDYYLEHKHAGLDYLGFGDWQRQYGRWLVAALDLKAKRLLDVGCACGSILRGFGEAGAVAQGVDLCEAMVRRGRETWPDMAGLLHVCDAVNLHLYRDASWHALHSAQVAEHWKPELVPFILRELARVTVPGGLFFCALDTEELFARQGRRLEHEDPTHVCIRPMRWWHEQLASAGWQLCTADYEPRLRAHPDTFLTRYDWDWFVARRAGPPFQPDSG